MSNKRIEADRIKRLNTRQVVRGRYVLYWMQQAQRTTFNHALEYAIGQANTLNLPLIVAFGITDRFPEANARHYAFMLQGLKDVQEALARRGIRFVLRHESPRTLVTALAGDAALVVADRGYLNIQVKWRRAVARETPCPLVQIETDVVVPVETVSEKEEYAARTIRPKIHRQLDRFLHVLRKTKVANPSRDIALDSLDATHPDTILDLLRIDRGVGPTKTYPGGMKEAQRRLRRFIRNKLDHYDEGRNEPAHDGVSHMSPYLHFGQISPVQIALEILRSGASQENKDAYIEELIVRRELSMNFVHYNADYASFAALPDWARKTLADHEGDTREHLYTREALENAQTHDPYWNAAQAEMVLTGKMHNYMRMYWGKKIIEWSPSPEEAFETTLHLNNKYELDGRDPNSFTGVAWCFGKHDRPWTERPIFGKVRYMNAAGLRRKFDMDAYLNKVDGMS